MHILVRLWRVNRALWGYLAWWACVRAGLIRPETQPALRFASTLENLGGTFVKLGQALSLHGELLSDDYIAALRKLQDHANPFSSALAREEIEKSLGGALTKAFSSFETAPMAAGSIAQVHRAVLLDGRQVIVKVRRPGIRREINEDIRVLRWFVSGLVLLAPSLRRLLSMELINELSRNLNKEISFRQEAWNMERFVELFRNSSTVFVPGVVRELSSDWVLVQEMSTGRRIDDPTLPGDRRRRAQQLVDAYVYQIFEAGIFHGDPHPGNIFVLEDGRICLHDFGLIGFLDRNTQANLAVLLQAFLQQNPDWMLDAYLDLGILVGDVNRAEFRCGLSELIQDYGRMPLRDWSFAEAFLRIIRIGRSQNVRIPQNLLVLLRAISLMESTLRRLDPDFNLMEGFSSKAGDAVKAIAEPAGMDDFIGRLKYESLISLRNLPDELGRMVHRMRSAEPLFTLRHSGLEVLGNEIRRTGRRIVMALLSLGLYIAASLLMQHSTSPRLGVVPALAGLGYVLALWLTIKALRDR